nr:sigma-54-dependent Fis family transcriptional regulator [uncultured bacterium]
MDSKILIVDDDEHICQIYKEFLAREGREIFLADSFESSWGLISKNSFDVVIIDIILGNFSGIDILQEIKNKGLNTPVIMVTGDPNIETASEALRLGAFDYLGKPVRKDAFLRVIRNALKHKEILDEKDRLEKENERYRRNLEAIFTSLQDAIITVDQNGKVIEANESTNNICAFVPRENIGQQFRSIKTQCNKSCMTVLDETLRTKMTVKEFRVECHRVDRPGQVALITASPLIDRDGNFAGGVLVVRDITRLSNLERELKDRHRFHRIIGQSDKMLEVYSLLENLSETEASVLISGESGTGKELVADALHYTSIRSGKPIVKVNCSALAENLLESELFGHVRGAFTGAVKDKSGRFQIADGGTIFLDEIGDISPRIQLKLLRFLQEREFEQVGDSRPIKVDVRVLAATNRDLKEMVKSGEFREDLYYRLKVVGLNLPPLRERREDIPILTEHFCNRFNKRHSKKIEDISGDVLALFMEYEWYGNVRELEHAIEHAFVLCQGQTITVQHLPSELKNFSKAGTKIRQRIFLDEPEKIAQILRDTDWNKAKAARILGISRPTLYQKIKEYGISKSSPK